MQESEKAGNSQEQSKIILGYDLNDREVQLCYCRREEKSPRFYPAEGEGGDYSIPAVLFAGQDGAFLAGEQALLAKEEQEGCLIRGLLEKAAAGTELRVGSRLMTGALLLTIFFKETLKTLFAQLGEKEILALTITVERLDEETAKVLSELAKNSGIPPSCFSFQSYEESFCRYVVSQQRELWKHAVLALDYGREIITACRLYINIKTKPMVALTEETTYAEVSFTDEEMAAVSEDLMRNGPVSAVYLIGGGLDGEAMKKTLKILCQGRRVFQGKNLYTKGACYGGLERLGIQSAPLAYVYLGKNQIRANIGMKVNYLGSEIYYPLADGGADYRAVKTECEFIIREENQVSVVITPLDGSEVRNIEMILRGLVSGSGRVSRIHMSLFFPRDNLVSITLKDLGFGEIFPSSGRVWEEKIEL